MIFTGKEIYTRMLEVASKIHQVNNVLMSLATSENDYAREVLANQLSVLTETFDKLEKSEFIDNVKRSERKLDPHERKHDNLDKTEQLVVTYDEVMILLDWFNKAKYCQQVMEEEHEIVRNLRRLEGVLV